MATIHPSAILEGDITLADDVEIGPFCYLRGSITLGAGVRLVARVNLQGPLTIGAGTVVWPGASLGFEPQDYKFTPGMETAGVVIGERCLIREHCTVHSATKDGIPTRVGDEVFMMVNAHVGHDAIVGDGVILSNNTALAGHSEVRERAILSAGSMVHQFTRVGHRVMTSGGTVILGDIPPFCMAAGRNKIVGLNLVGLRRSGMDQGEINAVKEAFRRVLRMNPPRDEMLAMLKERGEQSSAVREIYEFVTGNKRPIAKVVKKGTPDGAGV